MQESIVVHRGEFGSLSVLGVSGDFVTHAHSDVHILLWVYGASGEMTVGGRSVRPGRNLAVGVNSFEPHCHTLQSNDRARVFLAFYINPDWLRYRGRIPASTAIFADPAIPVDDDVHRLALRLVTGRDCLAPSEVEDFLDSLMDVVDANRARAEAPMPALAARDFRIRKAISLMKANVTRRICFDKVAKSVGLSRPHFFALFKEQLNTTPNVYWNMLRMEEALRQLQQREDRVTAVAGDLGFTKHGNFSRFFRDHVGVSPALYRTAARQLAMLLPISRPIAESQLHRRSGTCLRSRPTLAQC